METVLEVAVAALNTRDQVKASLDFEFYWLFTDCVQVVVEVRTEVIMVALHRHQPLAQTIPGHLLRKEFVTCNKRYRIAGMFRRCKFSYELPSLIFRTFKFSYRI